MKLHTLLLGSLISLLGFSAMAEIDQIEPGSREDKVAMEAININAVYNLKVGDIAYKVVSMESELNSDTSGTTLIFAGENGAVGGEAGADGAFLVGPTEKNFYLRSARVVKNEIELTFGDIDLKVHKTLYHFDAKAKTLIERDAK